MYIIYGLLIGMLWLAAFHCGQTLRKRNEYKRYRKALLHL